MGQNPSEWKHLIAHISDQWKKKKSSEYPYPFVGRDFRDIKGLQRVYGVFGVMALWDVFLSLENDFNKRSGYSLWQFQRQLPFLVDDRLWRAKRDKYEEKFNSSQASEGSFDTTGLFSLKILQNSQG